MLFSDPSVRSSLLQLWFYDSLPFVYLYEVSFPPSRDGCRQTVMFTSIEDSWHPSTVSRRRLNLQPPTLETRHIPDISLVAATGI